MLSLRKYEGKLFYGWVIVTAFFIVNITLYGIHFSFGLFFKSIESEFNLTRTATSSIASANLVLAGICAFAAGWALDKYGPKIVVLLMGIFAGLSLLLTSQTNSAWQLFLTYSLLLSMGTGALYVVPTSTVSRWFNQKRGIALGISGAGTGLGIVIMAPFATYLISSFDWRTAYIVMGLLAWLIVIPVSLLLKREPREIGALPDGITSPSTDTKAEESSIPQAHFSLSQVFKTRSFWIILFTWLLFASSLFLVFTHLVPHVTDIGFSPAEAAGILSALGVSAIAGRVLMGIMSDKLGRKLTPIIGTLLMAGSLLWLTWADELWMLYLFALVYGFTYSGLSSSMGAFVGDVFGVGSIGAIFGMLEIGWGIGAALGPAMGGLIFDYSGTYSAAFLIEAFAILVMCLLIASIRRETIGDY